jgi:hypothetical protein
MLPPAWPFYGGPRLAETTMDLERVRVPKRRNNSANIRIGNHLHPRANFTSERATVLWVNEPSVDTAHI